MGVKKTANRSNKILHLFLFVYALLTIPFLSQSPPVWFDEGLLSEVGWHLVEEGHFAQPLWTGYLNYENFSTHPNYLYYLFLAISFKLFGLGIFQARLVSVLSGFFLILFLHYVVKRAWSSKVANMTTMLLVLNPLFILSARMARQEIMTALFAFLCLGLIMLGIQEKKSVLIFLAGFFGTVTFLTHLNGLFICFAGFILLLLAREWKYLFYFLAGGAITAIPFALFVVSHLDIFIYQFFELWSYRLPSSSSRILTNVLTEPTRWLKGITTPLSMFIGILGFLYCLPKVVFISPKKTKKRRNYISIYVLLIIIILCFTLFDYHKYYGYLVIVLPFFSILSGVLFTELISSGKKKKKKLAILLLFLLLTTYLGVVQYKVWGDRNANYWEYCDQVKDVINGNGTTKESIEDQIILADALFWFCFPDGNLRSIITFIWIHQYSGQSYAKIFAEQKIDYVILDPVLYLEFQQDALQFAVTDEYRETVEACKVIGTVNNGHYTEAKKDDHATIIYRCIEE